MRFGLRVLNTLPSRLNSPAALIDKLFKKTSNDIGYKDFSATASTKIFSAYQSCPNEAVVERFRGFLCLHHLGMMCFPDGERREGL